MSSSDTKTKITDWVDPKDKSGEFKRQVSSFRDRVSGEPGAKFPPNKGRYHLFVSYACPWAHRTLVARKLKGLEDFVSFSFTHAYMGEGGWRLFSNTDSKDEATGEDVSPDPLPGHEMYTHLSDVYFQVEPSYKGRFTVPVLYDKVAKTIVNNESSDILEIFNSAFNNVLPESFSNIDLFPADLRGEMNPVLDAHYNRINNGVYKSGFATTNEAYARNVTALFEELDAAEKHLAAAHAKSNHPYWFGERMTAVDVRLYTTLIRFDVVYVQHFKCNIRDIRSGYPHLHQWLRQLYWDHDAFRSTTDFKHIRYHYTRSHKQVNPLGITPLGPLPDILPLGEEVAAVGAKVGKK